MQQAKQLFVFQEEKYLEAVGASVRWLSLS